MFQQLPVAGIGHACQAEKAQVVAGLAGERGFAQRLPGVTADSGYLYETLARLAFEPGRGLRRQSQHRLVKARAADRELCGVYSHGDAARSRLAVIARQRRLPPLVEFPRGGQRQRMRRNHYAPVECLPDCAVHAA